MPYDGNGNFVRVHNWTADAANSLDINASEMDAEDNGIAAALSNAVTRDGQGKMGADFLPSVDNSYNLGNGSHRWASLNGVQIPSGATPWAFTPQTAAEALAGVTPSNFFYAELAPNRYASQANFLSVASYVLNNFYSNSVNASRAGGFGEFGNAPWNVNNATGDPPHILEVTSDNSGCQTVRFNTYGTSFSNDMHWCRYRGTQAAPAVVQSGDYFMSMGFRGWDGAGVLSQSLAAYQCQANENWSTTNHGTRFHWDITPTGGATVRQAALDLYAGQTESVIAYFGGVGNALPARLINGSQLSYIQIHGDGLQAGAYSQWFASLQGTTPNEAKHFANRMTFLTVAGVELFRSNSAGFAINKGSDATYTLEIKAIGSSAFNFENTSGNAIMYCTNGTGTFNAGENAAATGLNVRKDGTTSRSINAAGTINASGADYAEYMRKSVECGIAAKGQILGVDRNGELTDKWASAITFLVKSTNPSYVGGDSWGHEDIVGKRPELPVFQEQPYEGAPPPGELSPTYQESTLDSALQAQRDAAKAAHQQALEQYQSDVGAHAQKVAAAKDQYDTVTMAQYSKALAAYEARVEAERQKVDRIAFSGQVPCNVLGASPGDYIIPMQDGDGIKGIAVTKPTIDQYQLAVGKVIALESDGRARIIVKVA